MEKKHEQVHLNVILDLLPAYIAGEASAESRELVESYAKQDPEIARLLSSGKVPLADDLAAVKPPDHLEKKTLERLRKSIRMQMLKVAVATATLLLIPMVAMQFTDEVQWDLADFLVMGLLLSGTGFLYVLIARVSDSKAYRLAVGIALVTAFLLVWISLAVGIIGAEGNPVNLLYVLVLATAFIGSVAVRFRAAGLALVLFLTAAIQLLVPFVAFFLMQPDLIASQNLPGVFFINTVLALLFAVSGYLFRKSTR